MKTAKSAIAYVLAIATLLTFSIAAVHAQKQSKEELRAEVAKWKQLAEDPTARANAAEMAVVQAQKQVKISQAKAERAEGWMNFAGGDLPYEQTCENLPRNDK
ncbi:MAG TPA: hypothetical protein VG737_01455 [Cyclobacteriaceae bacterium]|nr:hypothetical protein [Cyclobacteriaceae bacterium]